MEPEVTHVPVGRVSEAHMRRGQMMIFLVCVLIVLCVWSVFVLSYYSQACK